MSRSRRLEEDPEHAAKVWEQNKKNMMQEDEVTRRLYAELDLLEAKPEAPRGSQVHQEMVSDFVKQAMARHAQLKAAVEADVDVFQMFRSKSDADLAEVGLKRVQSGNGSALSDAAGGTAGAGGSRLAPGRAGQQSNNI